MNELHARYKECVKATLATACLIQGFISVGGVIALKEYLPKISEVVKPYDLAIPLIPLPVVAPLAFLWIRTFERSRWKKALPEFDFDGKWCYRDQYRLEILDKTMSDPEKKQLEEMFLGRIEEGTVHVRQTALGFVMDAGVGQPAGPDAPGGMMNWRALLCELSPNGSGFLYTYEGQFTFRPACALDGRTAGIETVDVEERGAGGQRPRYLKGHSENVRRPGSRYEVSGDTWYWREGDAPPANAPPIPSAGVAKAGAVPPPDSSPAESQKNG